MAIPAGLQRSSLLHSPGGWEQEKMGKVIWKKQILQGEPVLKKKTSISLFAGLGGERGNESGEAAVRGCRGVCRRGAVRRARPRAARKAIYSPFPCGFPKLLPGYCQDYSELQIWTQMRINFSQSCSWGLHSPNHEQARAPPPNPLLMVPMANPATAPNTNTTGRACLQRGIPYPASFPFEPRGGGWDPASPFPSSIPTEFGWEFTLQWGTGDLKVLLSTTASGGDAAMLIYTLQIHRFYFIFSTAAKPGTWVLMKGEIQNTGHVHIR